MRDFRKLEIWGQSLAFVKTIYELTSTFPAQERYGLISQMNRSAVSIPSNIAEGCSRNSVKDFSRFLEFAIGSSFELETQIEIGVSIHYISKDQYTILIQKLHILQRRINLQRERLKN